MKLKYVKLQWKERETIVKGACTLCALVYMNGLTHYAKPIMIKNYKEFCQLKDFKKVITLFNKKYGNTLVQEELIEEKFQQLYDELKGVK